MSILGVYIHYIEKRDFPHMQKYMYSKFRLYMTHPYRPITSSPLPPLHPLRPCSLLSTSFLQHSIHVRPYICQRPLPTPKWGLLTPKIDTETWHFFKLTCDMEPSDVRKKDKGHNIGCFLKLTCDMQPV